MVPYIFYILLGIILNVMVGAAVWVAIDSPDEKYYEWYIKCPSEIAWFAQPLVLSLWFVGLYWHFKVNRSK